MLKYSKDGVLVILTLDPRREKKDVNYPSESTGYWLNEQGFIRLNRVATDTFYQSGVAKLWKGHRLLGVDETRLVLPNHATVKKEFGTCRFGSKAESERSLAIASTLFDALNQLTLDGRWKTFTLQRSQWKKNRRKSIVKKTPTFLKQRRPAANGQRLSIL